MKPTLISIAFAAFAAAAPQPARLDIDGHLVNGVAARAIQNLDIDGHPIAGVAGRAVCNADNPLRDLRNTKVAASASIFCSALLQKTVTVQATSTVPLTFTVSKNKSKTSKST